MVKTFGIGLRDEAIRALFHVQEPEKQVAVMQSAYDAGYSGTHIGKLFDVPNVYARIDAHRGRCRTRRVATAM